MHLAFGRRMDVSFRRGARLEDASLNKILLAGSHNEHADDRISSDGSPLLQWLPDETLYSLAARHHRFWGHSLASATAEALFGTSRVATYHDLPGGLAAFVALTSGVYGGLRVLALERTLLQFYRPFCLRCCAR